MSLESNLDHRSNSREVPERATLTACEEFKPEGKAESLEGSAVVYLPGWSMKAKDSVSANVSQAYANESGLKTFSITTYSNERGAERTAEGREPDYLYEEATVVARRVKELGLREVTLVGHSQGGDRAIDVAVQLQKDPSVSVRGLVLISPVGITEQDPAGLVVRFMQDTTNAASRKSDSSSEKLRSNARKLLAGIQVATNVGIEAVRSGGGYRARLASEVREMAQRNPHMKEVTVPVVLVLGKEDRIANPDEVTLAAIDEAARNGTAKQNQISTTDEEGHRVVIPGTGEVMGVQEVRAYTMKGFAFERSPFVSVLRPEGAHLVPFTRPEQLAKVTLGVLDRYYRGEK